MTALGLAARFVHLAAGVGVVGIAAMLLIAGRSDRPTAVAWQERMLRWAQSLVLLALVAGVATVAVHTALLEGRAAAAMDPRALARVLLETQAGTVWLVRTSLLLLLGVFLTLRDAGERGVDWLALRGESALLGLAALGLLGASGHAAAVEPDTARAIAVDAVHLVAAGMWAGALPPLAALLFASGAAEGADARPYAVLAARGFSRWALVAVVVLVVSGTVNAATHVGSVPALLGTPYGRLLLVKVALLVPILALAGLNRSRWLPALSGDAATVGRPAMRRLARSVGAEVALVLLILAVAAAMTTTPPARHEEPAWPFSFRLSGALLAHAPELRTVVLVGTQIAIAGLVALLSALLLRGWRLALLGAAFVLLVVGGAVALPPLVIDAYPTTYRRPAVPYTAASIARGADVYAAHCVACHGTRGAGDGPAGRGLPRPPADLRAEHTGDHTAGDLFWWLTHGIPRGGMPGFADRLSEEDRWDAINFVRALGAAAAVRRLGPEVELERPWLAAPDFTFTVGPTPARSLRDYRGEKVVLVVLYALPRSRTRMSRLAERHDSFAKLGAEVIAVPMDASPDAIAALGAEPPILFPVVTEGAGDVVRTYAMLASDPAHAEFLVDRQGYLRARSGGKSLDDVNRVLAEIQRLNDEKPVAAPAAEHVH
jgi:putative copper resistance protein D